MKLLLTSVFGPYGVDDEYGRKENLMEVLHNQVTREQGVFSMRFNQETYGLYLLAENLSIPTVILDFPSQRRFINEIKKGSPVIMSAAVKASDFYGSCWEKMSRPRLNILSGILLSTVTSWGRRLVIK